MVRTLELKTDLVLDGKRIALQWCIGITAPALPRGASCLQTNPHKSQAFCPSEFHVFATSPSRAILDTLFSL